MKRTLLAVAFAVLAVSACTERATVPPPTVVIPAGLHPRMTLAEVEELVLDRIHSMEQAAGVVLRPARVLRIEAIAGGPAAPGFDGVTWEVKAEGTFISNRGQNGVVGPAETGSFEILDADGTIRGFGFP